MHHMIQIIALDPRRVQAKLRVKLSDIWDIKAGGPAALPLGKAIEVLPAVTGQSSNALQTLRHAAICCM